MSFLLFVREMFTFTALLATLYVWTLFGYAMGL